MGMPISIDIRDAAAHAAPRRVEPVLDAAFASLRTADATFSLWRPETAMSRLNAGRATLRDVPVVVAEVLRECVRWSALTAGRFSARHPDGHVDPSGLVKGWAIARVGHLLEAAGLSDWAVNAAGDVLVRGDARPARGWAVGIADPDVPGQVLDVVTLTGGAVATSGTAERGEHIWDPVTGRAARDVRSATVISADILTADVLATAAVARGRDACAWLAGFPGVRALVVLSGGEIQRTPHWGRPAGPDRT